MLEDVAIDDKIESQVVAIKANISRRRTLPGRISLNVQLSAPVRKKRRSISLWELFTGRLSM
ncbi:MAG: hypothetical protein ACI9R3_005736 [Verrucomicrobiales bacterium]|jgi:hypothetical protein